MGYAKRSNSVESRGNRRGGGANEKQVYYLDLPRAKVASVVFHPKGPGGVGAGQRDGNRR